MLLYNYVNGFSIGNVDLWNGDTTNLIKSTCPNVGKFKDAMEIGEKYSNLPRQKVFDFGQLNE